MPVSKSKRNRRFLSSYDFVPYLSLKVPILLTDVIIIDDPVSKTSCHFQRCLLITYIPTFLTLPLDHYSYILGVKLIYSTAVGLNHHPPRVLWVLPKRFKKGFR